MDSDPWADAPSTPKLPSHPSTPARSPVTPARKSLEHSSPLNSTLSPSLENQQPPPASSPKTSSPLDSDAALVSPAQTEAVAEDEADEEAGAEEDVGDDGFDDFDDFDEPASAESAIAGPSGSGSPTGPAALQGDDDGFGDFGDFEEGDFEEPSADVTQQQQPVAQERWVLPQHALQLRPLPPRSELLDQLTTLLEPLYDLSDQSLTDDQPRIGTGLSQVLVTESSRDVYAQLTTAPMMKSLDWTRSRVRREHLISMGVPVNLDEVDSHRISALPPLRITTGAMGPPPPRRAGSLDINGRYTAKQKGKGRDLSPVHGSQSVPSSAGGVNGNAAGKSAMGKYGLGAKPELDQAKAEELCGLEEGQLSILPIAALRRMQEDLVTNTAQASALLAWLLQLKDAQTQDSATYNGMISELIANAAKVKSAQAVGSGGVFRRASAKTRPQSASGNATPRRTGSPGMWG